MTENDNPSMSVKDITLRQILDRALTGWRTPVIFSAVAVLFALIGLTMSRPIYSVEMSVVPAPSSQAENGMTPGGGLSSVLGLVGGGQTNSTYQRYQKLLTSTAVAERMQQKHDMLHVVFADLWDKHEQKWVKPPRLRDTLLAWLFDLAHVPIWTPPDITDLAEYLKGKIIILPGVQSDIVTLSMQDADPAFATRTLLSAHTLANEVLRDQVATRAAQQVNYLQHKLSQTTVEDYRQTLLTLLSTQEKTLMLTQTSAPYAAEILTPPTSSARPVAPRPVLSIAVAILVGILAGVSTVIFFGPDWWQKLCRHFETLRMSIKRKQRAFSGP
jgi:uncharacterized protein involved in exopolysaccharide biosynthesis